MLDGFSHVYAVGGRGQRGPSADGRGIDAARAAGEVGVGSRNAKKKGGKGPKQKKRMMDAHRNSRGGARKDRENSLREPLSSQDKTGAPAAPAASTAASGGGRWVHMPS